MLDNLTYWNLKMELIDRKIPKHDTTLATDIFICFWFTEVRLIYKSVFKELQYIICLFIFNNMQKLLNLAIGQCFMLNSTILYTIRFYSRGNVPYLSITTNIRVLGNNPLKVHSVQWCCQWRTNQVEYDARLRANRQPRQSPMRTYTRWRVCYQI